MKESKKSLMAMNLQFFAEDDESASDVGVNETEAADQSETADVDTDANVDIGATEETAEPQKQEQSRETNAAFANMRRELEAMKRQQQEIDESYARQYGHLVNPETNQPIRGARDYFEALAAQERMNAREQLQQANVDPSLIDKMIQNSPVIRQAEAATAELNNIRARQMMEEDFKEVLRMDPTLSSQEDIIKADNYQDVVSYVQTHPGMRFSDAYKLVNFDRLASSRTAAAKQAAINDVKGKNHLSTGAALNVADNEEDIPPTMIEKYKELFPDKSMKELKSLYNKTIASRR